MSQGSILVGRRAVKGRELMIAGIVNPAPFHPHFVIGWFQNTIPT